MNPQTIRNLVAKAATAVGLLIVAGTALALPNYVTTTNNYCTSIGRPRATPIGCDGCHVANRATRVDPEWTWYQAAPKGASTQMANFCPPATTNQAPNGTISAPAGNVTIAQGGTVAFAGSGTDPDNNTPLTYAWNFGGGAANSTQQNPSVVFNAPGTFAVSLTVTDSLGLADPSPATRTVTVTPSSTTNQAPNGTITQPASDQVINVGQSVSFSGNGTDPDNNTPLTYAWNFGGGAPNSNQQNPAGVTFATPGTFTVSLTVTDSKGLADSTPATRVVTVMAPNNQPPTASITNPPTDISILKGASVTFRGVGSDPDGNTPLTYRWNFGGGGLPDSTLQNPMIRFDNVGTYSVTLTVTDRLGGSGAAPIRIVTVRAPLPTGCRDSDRDGFSPDGGVCGPIDCNDGNAALNPGMTERCGDGIDNDCNGKVDAADSACNGTDCLAARPPVIISRARWEAEDRKLEVRGNGAPSGAAANLFDAATGALLASVVVERDGDWEFEIERLATPPCRVRVDIAGQSAEAAVSGAPSSCSGGGGNPPPGNLAPDGRISAPSNGVQVRLGRSVQFSGSGSDPDGNLPLSYAWDFGGGATASTGQNPRVTFGRTGIFAVRLTVKDGKGLADPTPAQITVRVVREGDDSEGDD